MQECRQLEVLRLSSYTRIVSLELFQGDAVWPCAPRIKKLCLDFKPLGMEPKLFHNHHYAPEKSVPVFSTMEQRQIWSRLQSMVNLRLLQIAGYPIDFEVVDDMSFAKRLEFGSVTLTVRVPPREMAREREGIVATAEEWRSRNRGWSYRLHEVSVLDGPRLRLTYVRCN